MKAATTLRRLVTDAQVLFGEVLSGGTSERGQTLIEGAMIMGVVAILAVSLLTVLGDATGGALGEISQVFSASGQDQSTITRDAYIGPRIAD